MPVQAMTQEEDSLLEQIQSKGNNPIRENERGGRGRLPIMERSRERVGKRGRRDREEAAPVRERG